MKIIIAPDKFKGSLTSAEVCQAITAGILKNSARHKIFHFPMADGGDGFNNVLHSYFHTRTVNMITVDPIGRSIMAKYQLNRSESLAIIEMASASGLVLLNETERNPMLTSSIGTGILIADAYRLGARRIILGLGGSATNDAGIGILSQLGFMFKDAAGNQLDAVGGNLTKIYTVIPPSSLPEISFEIAADVVNPLYGPNGAAYVYGPQKGADKEMVELLDQGLRHFADLIKRQFSKKIADFDGAGAAGGVAAGLTAFFDVKVKKGVELVLETNKLEASLSDADLVITGEGKIDDQSGYGKVVGTIASLAAKHKVPCIAFCGQIEADERQVSTLQLNAIHPIADSSKTNEENMQNAYSLLCDKAAAVFSSYPH